MYTKKAQFLIRYLLAVQLGKAEYWAVSYGFSEPYDDYRESSIRLLLRLALFHLFTNYTFQNLLFRYQYEAAWFNAVYSTDVSFLRSCNKIRELHGIEARVFFDELESFGIELDTEVVKTFKRAIEEERSNVLCSLFREYARLKGKIKALIPPLQIIPQSLRPIESLAH